MQLFISTEFGREVLTFTFSKRIFYLKNKKLYLNNSRYKNSMMQLFCERKFILQLLFYLGILNAKKNGVLKIMEKRDDKFTDHDRHTKCLLPW